MDIYKNVFGKYYCGFIDAKYILFQYEYKTYNGIISYKLFKYLVMSGKRISMEV